MKARINFLTLIFSLSIFAIIFSSCQKEPLVHPLASSKVAIAETPSSVQSIIITDDEIQKQQVSEITMTYEEALESIDPDVRPDWGVAIKSFTCVRSGQTLLVYNPYNSSLDFYDSRRFSVHWFKDGSPVRGTVRLECMCKGRYAVIVINRGTQQGIGIAFHSISHACAADEVSTKSDGTY